MPLKGLLVKHQKLYLYLQKTSPFQHCQKAVLSTIFSKTSLLIQKKRKHLTVFKTFFIKLAEHWPVIFSYIFAPLSMQGCNANFKEKVKLAGKGILVQGNSANISMFSLTILTVKTVFTQFSTIMASWLLLTFFIY